MFFCIIIQEYKFNLISLPHNDNRYLQAASSTNLGLATRTHMITVRPPPDRLQNSMNPRDTNIRIWGRFFVDPWRY